MPKIFSIAGHWYLLRSKNRIVQFNDATLELALMVGLGFAIVHAASVLLFGISRPPLDFHAFRQTQTALSIYWMLQGGPWLAYETPVLGYPWSIPFEFPIYQLIVLVISKFGTSIEVASRLVSFLFFLGVLWPLGILYSELRLSRLSYLTTAILYICCPLYMYWSCTIMIETCALFFSMMWLALVIRFCNRQSWRVAVAAIAVGSLAMLAKSTTAIIFALVGSFGFASLALTTCANGVRLTALAKKLSSAVFLIAVPLIAGFVWVVYSDHLKSANEFGAMTTSAALFKWNFGTTVQRTSRELWVDVIQQRTLFEMFGAASLVGIATLGISLTASRTSVVAVLAIVSFLLPFFIFTNLYMVHNYYQVANAIFLIAAVGIAIGRLFDFGKPMAAVAVIVILVVGQCASFYSVFFPAMAENYAGDRELGIAKIAKERTEPDQAIIVFGLDWSSAVAYFSERKALTIPYWAGIPLIERVLADPQFFLGERRLGGIVTCDENLSRYFAPAEIATFLSARSELGRFGGCRFLGPWP